MRILLQNELVVKKAIHNILEKEGAVFDSIFQTNEEVFSVFMENKSIVNRQTIDIILKDVLKRHNAIHTKDGLACREKMVAHVINTYWHNDIDLPRCI